MMRAQSPRRTTWLAAAVAAAFEIALTPWPCAAESRSGEDHPSGAARAHDTQQLCANVAASIEVARIARQRKLLSDMETQLGARLAALEAKESEVRAALDRLESFERKTNDALVAFYAGMKPDVAAAQISQLDDDSAAALMLRLKTKASSAILNEMEAVRGAAIARKIAQKSAPTDGKRP